jgi:hypothetical protein
MKMMVSLVRTVGQDEGLTLFNVILRSKATKNLVVGTSSLFITKNEILRFTDLVLSLSKDDWLRKAPSQKV